jgi:hypothetical protein
LIGIHRARAANPLIPQCCVRHGTVDAPRDGGLDGRGSMEGNGKATEAGASEARGDLNGFAGIGKSFSLAVDCVLDGVTPSRQSAASAGPSIIARVPWRHRLLDCDVPRIVLGSRVTQVAPDERVRDPPETKGDESMATLSSFRLATPFTARFASRIARIAGLVLTVAAALYTPACGSKSDNNLEALCPTTSRRVAATPAMTAVQFCQLYLQTCVDANNPPGGYTTMADCQAAYPSLMFETARECRSYHLCNAASYDATAVLLHCRHTMGLGICVDSMSGL